MGGDDGDYSASFCSATLNVNIKNEWGFNDPGCCSVPFNWTVDDGVESSWPRGQCRGSFSTSLARWHCCPGRGTGQASFVSLAPATWGCATGATPVGREGDKFKL